MEEEIALKLNYTGVKKGVKVLTMEQSNFLRNGNLKIKSLIDPTIIDEDPTHTYQIRGGSTLDGKGFSSIITTTIKPIKLLNKKGTKKIGYAPKFVNEKTSVLDIYVKHGQTS